MPKSIARTMTGIGWTDFTANAWAGCTEMPASPGGRSGCVICYAKTFAERRMGIAWGPGMPRVAMVGFRARVARLDRLAAATGMAFSVFALSLGDWLDAEVEAPMRNGLIDAVEGATHLTWLLLTHRPHMAARLLPSSWASSPPANVWPGVTVDHPAHAFRWAQHLAYWSGTGRAWASAEPLSASLAAVDLSEAACVVIGGASNVADAGWELDPAWVGEAVGRYGEGRVYFKQHGDYRNGVRVGKKAAGNDIAGRTYERTPWPRHREALAAAAA